jgi:hypothetical protein
MLDFINDDNENGAGHLAGQIPADEEDFISHIENLWQTHGAAGAGSGANHIVLGHQLGLGGGVGGARNYQINILGGGANLAIAPSVEHMSLPTHPLSVSAVHPLLVHNNEVASGNLSSSVAPPSGNPFQITGLGMKIIKKNLIFFKES